MKAREMDQHSLEVVLEDTAPSKNRVDAQKILGPPALFLGEDHTAYNTLLEHIRASLNPQDIIEEIWVREFVDHTWDERRLRHVKADLWRLTSAQGLFALLRRDDFNADNAYNIISLWGKKDPIAVADVDKRLKATGCSIPNAIAECLGAAYVDDDRLEAIERIDRLIASVETRRNSTIREMERRRGALAAAARRVTEEPIEAEFTDVHS